MHRRKTAGSGWYCLAPGAGDVRGWICVLSVPKQIQPQTKEKKETEIDTKTAGYPVGTDLWKPGLVEDGSAGCQIHNTVIIRFQHTERPVEIGFLNQRQQYNNHTTGLQ